MHKILGPVLQKVHFAPQVRHLRDGFNVMCDFAIIAMTNLPSVSYMIGQFQNAISGSKPKREANPLGSLNIGLWYSLSCY